MLVKYLTPPRAAEAFPVRNVLTETVITLTSFPPVVTYCAVIIDAIVAVVVNGIYANAHGRCCSSVAESRLSECNVRSSLAADWTGNHH